MAKKHRSKPKARKKRVATKRNRPRKRKVTGSVKKKPTKRRKRRSGRKVVKQVERRSVERVMTGRKRKRRRKHTTTHARPRKRRVVMAGSRPRRRSVGGSGGSNKMLIGLGLGALALYLLTKKQTTTATQYPTNYQLPQVSQTSNLTRNSQSQEIVNYAIAAGLAADAITKIINSLNTSSDDEVKNVYDYVNTTGNIEYYA